MAARTPATKPGKPMALLQIGFENILLPRAAAVKILALLDGAMGCEDNFLLESGPRYRVNPAPLPVRMDFLQPSQIEMPKADSARRGGEGGKA